MSCPGFYETFDIILKVPTRNEMNIKRVIVIIYGINNIVTQFLNIGNISTLLIYNIGFLYDILYVMAHII